MVAMLVSVKEVMWDPLDRNPMNGAVGRGACLQYMPAGAHNFFF